MRICLMLSALCCCAALPAAADPVHDLVLAAQMDNRSTVAQLLDKGASPNTVDPATGESLLIQALREGSERVIDLLLARKDLQLEQNAPNGNTALMMAAFKRNQRAVEALLAKGAQVNRAGWTALHYAAASGDDEIARILIAHHAAVDAPSPSQLTPLMIAAREGHESTALVLLRGGADARLKNNEGLTAAQIAKRADKDSIAAAIDAFVPASR